MKRKLIWLILLVFLFSFCSKKEKTEAPEWKGKIEYENGIKVIRNPEEPVFGELVMELEEDLSIGNEEDENYMFYRAYSIALDNEDSIYVLDAGNHRIQKFDRNGVYLQTIGRKGQGPGEFESPFQIRIDKEGNIYVRDSRKIKIFDKEGNYTKDVVLKNFSMNFYLDSEGNIMAKVFKSTESGRMSSFDKISPEGKLLKTIAQFPYGMTVTKVGKAVIAVSHQYVCDLFISSINPQMFIYGYSKEYELFAVNEKGDILFKFLKEEPYHPISGAEKDKVRNQFKRIPDAVKKAIQFPPHRPFFMGILCDDVGRIYVLRFKTILDEKKGYDFDIFSKDGYYLYKTHIPYYPRIIKNGFLYTRITSEETGEELIKRYKIKNWSDIKERI
ncbi:NHL repeat-containing protein [Candidatus Aminicenantes bacterium AC-708-M15]|jgi:hypothetical protein|nr:NHL repeat-containing protein [SCandidatus Aminicenantes bacterium Aminicenantia_JdfR_composite]MCP2604326.1 NHL repeat-containing protein [Candidatus Aminicenantes bacterium AC-708-M15]